MTTEQIEQSAAAQDVKPGQTIGLSEIATRIGVNYETARRWAISGRLPVFKYNNVGHWRAHVEQVDEFIEKHKNKAATWSER